MIKIGLEEHKETILEALQDYRNWFKESPDEFDIEKIKNLNSAIEFVRGAK